jgi:hypothetical protein
VARSASPESRDVVQGRHQEPRQGCPKHDGDRPPHEVWTTRLLAQHAREHGPAAGHACLSELAQGTVCGKIKRIAIVAVARKLLVALWRYVTQGVIPEGAELKA